MPSKEYSAEEQQLLLHGVKPTATRLLVYRALTDAEDAQSLTDLETTLATVDKSTIFRSLTIFKQNNLVHEIDDGSGSVKYEVCYHEDDEEADNDQHAHFYCTECQHTYCLKEIQAPRVELPDGFNIKGINYVLKGTCPNCRKEQA